MVPLFDIFFETYEETGSNMSNKRYKHNFTLVELMVVLTMCAMITSMMIPTLSNLKEEARRNLCVDNMKKLAVGACMYSDDFDDWLPAYDVKGHSWYNRWQYMLPEYLAAEWDPQNPIIQPEFYRCPTQEEFSSPTTKISYAMHQAGSSEIVSDHWNQYTWIRRMDFYENKRTWLFAEANETMPRAVSMNWKESASFRHNGYTNAAYLNGAVRSIPIAGFQASYRSGEVPKL